MLYKPAVLAVVDLFKTFTQGSTLIPLFNGITYAFKQGHSYALRGASGSGKSTFLHILAGIENPTSGSVYFNNKSIALFSPSERASFLHTSISLIFQAPCLINELSVLENTMIKGLIQGEEYARAAQKAVELLEKVGIANKSSAFPAMLSGGEQQRVALARALFSNPAFILADEPTAHLDKQNKESIIELLLQCQHDESMGLVVASHDEEVIQAFQTTLLLNKGALIERISTHGS
ncbi:ABC transporter ATP-binding protein [Candidatus Dependentiae bacterium]|nr:ABC transporter ATP-binding protein [Candidatus Dependentiae bacterium]